MSIDFILASCEAEEILIKGDIITESGVDYIFEEVADWGYLYSDKGDKINPLWVSSVNGVDKRFGIGGVLKRIVDKFKNIDPSIENETENIGDFCNKQLKELYARYYNLNHPEVKAMFEQIFDN